ncbi:MAG: hypothetical protein LBD59_07530 [Prevotellaceae bacterium]|jgi:hypothetical protein|nr:hypothetical protein [Prevotellaceae bacterium]
MKYNILLLLAFCMCSICFAKKHDAKDSIQICYRANLDAIGGYDHCITLYFDDSLIYCKRICYSMLISLRTYMDAGLEMSKYEENQKQAILRHYQESSNYLVLDERVEVNKYQLDKFFKIIDEIKAFVPKGKSNPDEIIISTANIYYVIKDTSETTVIKDWNARYNRRTDIEKVLGLKSYLRCPCVEKDLKQMDNNQRRRRR